jgi:hypothetical protein
MDRLDLPKHILEKVERRWAQKLQQQAVAWKSTRSQPHGATNRSSSRLQSSLAAARRSRPALPKTGEKHK